MYLVHQLGAHHIKGRHGAGHEEPEDGDRESGRVGEWGSGREGERCTVLHLHTLVFLELGTGNHDVHMSCTHHSTFYMFGR